MTLNPKPRRLSGEGADGIRTRDLLLKAGALPLSYSPGKGTKNGAQQGAVVSQPRLCRS